MTKGQSAVLIVVALVILGGLVWLASQEPAITSDTPAVEDEMGEDAGDSPGDVEGDTVSAEEVGEEVAPGASRVDEEGRVVTDEGEQTRTDAEINDPDAPRQSDPISEGEVPEEAIQVDVSSTGYVPEQFSVDSGAAVTLSITSTDDQTHIFKFRDEVLQGVAVGVAPGETRAITFNAPEEGEYEYYCDVPGHDGRGENGVMIVE